MTRFFLFTVLLFISTEFFGQKLGFAFERSDIEKAGYSSQPSAFSHHQFGDYSNKYEVITRLNRNYEVNEASADIYEPLFTGFSVKLFPKAISFLPSKLRPSFSVGMGNVRQSESFWAFYNNEENKQEYFSSTMEVFRTYLSIGNQWDYYAINKDKLDFGLEGNILYQVNIKARSKIDAKSIEVNNGNTLFTAVEDNIEQEKRNFLNLRLGIFTELRISNTIDIRASVSSNHMFFGDDIYTDKYVFTPLYGLSIILKQ